MATNNFHVVNAKHYHVLSLQDLSYQECKRLLETIDEFLQEHGYDNSHGEKDWNMLNSYPSYMLDAYTSRWIKVDELPSICVNLYPVVRYGYYEDAVIDYNFSIECGDDDMLKDEDLYYYLHRDPEHKSYPRQLKEFFIERLEEMKYSGDVNIEDRAFEIADKVLEQLHDVREEFEHLIGCLNVVRDFRCVCVFSNGEAIYEEVHNSLLRSEG